MNRLAVVLLALAATPAFANGPVATLAQQQGTVLVNQGEVFTTAAEGQALKAGDRVMVMEGGHATLSFADGCELPLAEGSLVEMPAASPCAGAVANVQQIGPSFAQAPGDDDVGKHNREKGWDWGWAAFGLGIAILGVGLGDEPSSP